MPKWDKRQDTFNAVQSNRRGAKEKLKDQKMMEDFHQEFDPSYSEGTIDKERRKIYESLSD